MYSESLFPDLSFLGRQDSPASPEALLTQLSLLALAMQAQLATAPRFADEYTAESSEAAPDDAGEHQTKALEQAMVDTARLDTLLPAWQGMMNEWWLEQGQGGPSGPGLRGQIYRLFELELAAHPFAQPGAKHVLEDLLAPGEQSGDFGWLAVSTGAEDPVPFPGCMVITRELEDYQDGEDFVLYGLATGVWVGRQREEAADYLRQAVLDAASKVRLLPQAFIQALQDGASLHLHFRGLGDVPPTRKAIDDLGIIQHNLMTDLQDQVEAGPVAVSAFNAVARLDELVVAIQERVAEHLVAYRQTHQPHWRRNLQGEALEGYLALEQALAEARQGVDEHLGDLRDDRTFAAQRVRAWLETNLPGLDIPPEKTYLTVRNTRDDVGRERTYSLLDWVVSGGYTGYGLVAEMIEPELANRLTHAQMQRMINALDLKVDYRSKVAPLYNQAPTRLLLGEAESAQMSLCAQRAVHAHGLSEQHRSMIEALLKEGRPVEGISVHRITVWGAVLRGIFCFEHEGQYLLYSPGAPGGDFRWFEHLQFLQVAVVSMLATPDGMAYLMSRVRLKVRTALEHKLNRLETLAWHFDRVYLQDVKGSVRKAMANDLVSFRYDTLRLAVPNWYISASGEDRQRVASLDNELALFHPEHHALTQVPNLLAFAQQKAALRLNEFPGNKGRWIDPDTVMIETPDAALTFTQWMAWGYPTGFNFAASSTIRSTVGQDLSHLALAQVASAIRQSSSHIREVYSQHIEQAFPEKKLTDQDLSIAEQHKLELHRSMMSLKVRRDFLVASLLGHLDEQQSSWLKDISETPADDDILVKLHFERLSFRQLTHRIVEGGYLLANAPGQHLVYVSDAVNGVTVRTIDDIALSWHEENLGAFFTSRVASCDKAAMRELTRLRGSEPEHANVIIDAHAHTSRIERWEDDLRLRATQRIWDAQQQTTSIADRVFESLEYIVSPVIGVLGTAVGFLAMPLTLLASVVNLAMGSLTFARGAHAWANGERNSASLYFLMGGVGIVSAVGLGKAVSTVYSSLYPGPSGIFTGFLKEMVLEWGPKGAGAAGRVFDDELMKVLDLLN